MAKTVEPLGPNVRNPADRFGTHKSDLDSPAQFAFNITPTNGAGDTGGVLTTGIRALYVGGAGNVFCRPVGAGNASASTSVNAHFMGCAAGTFLPVRMSAVWLKNDSDITQNTTATGLVGLY